MKLTEEQKKLVEENHALIYSFAKKYNLNIEEYYGILAEALCLACRTWRSDGGAQISTYAYRKMLGGMGSYFRHKAKIKSAIPEESVVYGDSYWYDTEKTLFETIQDNYLLDSDVTTRVVLENFVSGLENRDKVIFSMMVCGERQETIAERVGINQSYVSRKQKKMRKELKELLCL